MVKKIGEQGEGDKICERVEGKVKGEKRKQKNTVRKRKRVRWSEIRSEWKRWGERMLVKWKERE